MNIKSNLKQYIRGSVALSVLASALFSLQSCTKSSESILKGSGLPAQYEGQLVFVENTMTGTVDSLKVTNGTFTHTIPVDTTILYYVDIEGNDAGKVSFIAEAGEHQLAPKEGADGFRIIGGRLNEELKSMTQTINEMMNNQSKAVMTILKDSTLNDEQKKSTHHEQVVAYETKSTELLTDYLKRNPDNAVGMVAFSRLRYKDDAEFIAAYEAQSEVVKQGIAQRTRYEKIQNTRKTQAGMPYTDFEIETISGDTIKFSDFMEEGKYLLVDFWASWCVPCRRVVPYVKEMIKRFPADSLAVVGIGCYDKPKPYTKAAEEEELPWKHVLDVNSNGAQIYGVSSIPHFILISPQGEIVIRATNIQHVEAVLEEKLLKK